MIRGGLVRLSVADLDRAVRFYVETLGVKLVAERTDEAVVDCGNGFQIALVKSPGGEHRGPVAVGLTTPMPLGEAIAILENRGVALDAERRFHDPDGNILFLASSGT